MSPLPVTDNPALFGAGSCGSHQQVYGVIVVGGEEVEPLVFLDFKNGVYTADGDPVVVGDLLTENTDFGTWNPARIQAGVGLVGNNDTSPVFTGDAIDLIAAGSTIVAYFTGTGGAFRFELVDSSDYTTFYGFKGTYADGQVGHIQDNTTTVELPELANGYHKIALTMIEGKISVSVDGGAVETVNPADPWTPPMAIMNMVVPLNAVTVETIGLYPPQVDADLPALSAL